MAENVVLGAVKFGYRVECWDQICIQLQLLPFSFRVFSPMILGSRHATESELFDKFPRTQ